jgi:hypothetical protein
MNINNHIDYINSKQTDFYGFDILSDRKPKEYDKNNLEINLGDLEQYKKFKTIFEDK